MKYVEVVPSLTSPKSGPAIVIGLSKKQHNVLFPYWNLYSYLTHPT